MSSSPARVGDLTVTGSLVVTGNNATLPDSALGNDVHDSGSPLGVDKTRHLPLPKTNFNLAIGDTVASREELVHVARGDETIKEFAAALNATGSTGDVDFDLKVNGSSVLDSVVNIANGDSDRTVKTGTVTSASLSDGDLVSRQGASILCLPDSLDDVLDRYFRHDSGSFCGGEP